MALSKDHSANPVASGRSFRQAEHFLGFEEAADRVKAERDERARADPAKALDTRIDGNNSLVRP